MGSKLGFSRDLPNDIGDLMEIYPCMLFFFIYLQIWETMVNGWLCGLFAMLLRWLIFNAFSKKQVGVLVFMLVFCLPKYIVSDEFLSPFSGVFLLSSSPATSKTVFVWFILSIL